MSLQIKENEDADPVKIPHAIATHSPEAINAYMEDPDKALREYAPPAEEEPEDEPAEEEPEDDQPDSPEEGTDL